MYLDAFKYLLWFMFTAQCTTCLQNPQDWKQKYNLKLYLDSLCDCIICVVLLIDWKSTALSPFNQQHNALLFWRRIS